MKQKEIIVPESVKLEPSLKEKERRWSLVRERMKKENLAAIIFYGDKRRDAPMRYLTGVLPIGAAQDILLFPADGDPIFLILLSRDHFDAQKKSWVEAENIYYSVNWSADLAKHLFALKLQKSRVGIDSLSHLPAQSYLELRKLCPDVELVEAAGLLNKIRNPKSDEELKLIEEAIRIGELAQRTFLANLKLGTKKRGVIGKELDDLVRANGWADGKLYMYPAHESGYPGQIPGETIMQNPDPVIFNVEFTRTRGYGCQVVRTYCWEEPKGEFKRMFELWGEIREMVLKLLRPGYEVTKLGAKIEEIAGKGGFESDYFGHGVGIKHADFPYITAGPHMARCVEWTVMANEVYCIHPWIRNKGGKPPLVSVGDMFLVGEDRTLWMTPFLPGLPEMVR